jgi:hypothetical protein
MDRVHDVCTKLNIQEKVMPKHKRTQRHAPVVRHGSYYGMLAAARTVEAEGSGKLEPDLVTSSNTQHWKLIVEAAKGLQEGRKIHFEPDESDIVLMSQHAELNAKEFNRKLIQNGLVMLVSSPDKYFAEVVKKQEAFAELRKVGYPQHKAMLRQPAEPEGKSHIIDLHSHSLVLPRRVLCRCSSVDGRRVGQPNDGE